MRKSTFYLALLTLLSSFLAIFTYSYESKSTNLLPVITYPLRIFTLPLIIIFVILATLTLLNEKQAIQIPWPTSIKGEKYLQALLLLPPSGFIMALTHEIGHLIWGLIAGGKLTYMQITFIILYPNPSITSTFKLGLVQMNNLKNPFNYGIFLLGGTLTTTIISYTIALTLNIKKLKQPYNILLTELGIIGLLDMPLYTTLPQINLPHWFIIGGTTPEPLIAIKKLNFPEPIYYLTLLLSLIILSILYTRSILKK
ncbi:MAG: hypothetical protein NDF54_08360 [archaeon GB-1867-035]|nr:hypothetical protein [Candidatus Culexmicrobium profundum]